MTTSFEEEFATWTPAAQERAVREIELRVANPYRPFYCPVPGCDGEPHGSWTWPHARWKQHPPPMLDSSWWQWVILSGRGWGKTRIGSEMCHRMARKVPRMAIVARNARSARQDMVEGPFSSLLATAPPDFQPIYYPARGILEWPNGCVGAIYSAEEPDSLRGPQNGFAWVDEAAAMDLIEDVWEQLWYTLRLPGFPIHAIVTTTPRPTPWIKKIVADPRTRVTVGPTEENLRNLSEVQRVRFEENKGTRMGRQELMGEILEDNPGALWYSSALIKHIKDDSAREKLTFEDLDVRVVGVDPAGSSNRRSDESGIVVSGKLNRDFYAVADLSGKYSPEGWARKAIDAYYAYDAQFIVVEKNFGADMVASTIRNIDDRVRIREIDSRISKLDRAKPAVAFYEQGRAWHFADFTKLEDQQLTWEPAVRGSKSPDRVDALVHGFNYLFTNSTPSQMTSAATLAVGRRRELWPGGPLVS